MRRPLGIVGVAAVLAGCGGGADSPPKPEPHGEKGGEQAARAQALRGVPRADRIAFFQVATATGTLRHWAANVSLGRSAAGERPALRAAAARLRALRPGDERLRRARAEALAALKAALGARPVDRRAGRRGLAGAERVSAVIDRVVRSDPRYSAVVPD